MFDASALLDFPIVASPLRDFAQRNNESLGLLFLEFLWQFAFELDPRTTVVSVNNFGEAAYGRERTTLSSRSFTKSRALKSMMSHWRMGSVLAIEDPFEHDYDVAHVLRSQVCCHLACALCLLLLDLCICAGMADASA